MAEQSRMSERLTDSVIMSSDIVYDLYCDVCCQEDEKYLEAEGYCVNCKDYLCRDCFKGHKSTRISRDHVLQDKTQMPHQKPSTSMTKQSSRSERPTASVIMSSDMVYDLYCEVCSEDGKHLEAVGYCVNCQDYLCTDCFKGHMRNRASSNHVLQDSIQMPEQKPLQSVSEQSSKQKCARHPGKPNDYICRDDKSLGCIFCMTMYHNLCTSIEHIPEIGEQLLDSQEYKHFTNTLDQMKTESQTVIKCAHENVIKAEKMSSEAASRLQELRKIMNDAFDKFERDLNNKANTIKSADLNKMQNVSDKGQTVFDEVKNISDELQSLQNKNQNDRVFILMIKHEDKIETLKKLLAEATTDNRVTAYTVEPGVQIQGILDDPISIGNLSVKAPVRPVLPPRRTKRLKKTPAPQPPAAQSVATTTAVIASSATKPLLKKLHSQTLAVQPAATTASIASSTTKPVLKISHSQPLSAQSALTAEPFARRTINHLLNKSHAQPHATLTAPTIANNPKHMEAVLVRDISVKTISDTEECRISGSALLPGNKIVLTDSGNSKVKLLNLQTSTVTSELIETLSQLWDMASIASDQVALTLPDVRKIVFLRVTDQLNMDREMLVNGSCRAILHNNGKLIVSFTDPKKMEIMTLNGTVERIIEQPGSCKFISYMALSLDCKTIYVAHTDVGVVKRIALDGTVKDAYTSQKLDRPRGLTVDQFGRVLICGGASHNIHLVTSDLTKVKVLVNKVDLPQSLSYCHNTCQLFVGTYSDHLKVYQLA